MLTTARDCCVVSGGKGAASAVLRPPLQRPRGTPWCFRRRTMRRTQPGSKHWFWPTHAGQSRDQRSLNKDSLSTLPRTDRLSANRHEHVCRRALSHRHVCQRGRPYRGTNPRVVYRLGSDHEHWHAAIRGVTAIHLDSGLHVSSRLSMSLQDFHYHGVATDHHNILRRCAPPAVFKHYALLGVDRPVVARQSLACPSGLFHQPTVNPQSICHRHGETIGAYRHQPWISEVQSLAESLRHGLHMAQRQDEGLCLGRARSLLGRHDTSECRSPTSSHHRQDVQRRTWAERLWTRMIRTEAEVPNAKRHSQDESLK